MIGDPYHHPYSPDEPEQTAKIIPPEAVPRNTKGAKILGLIVLVVLGLVIFGNILFSLAGRMSPPPPAPKPKTMTLTDSADFQRQQSGQAGWLGGTEHDSRVNQVLGQASGLAGEPQPLPPVQSASVATPAPASSGASAAEQEHLRRLQEAERRRQADMDASPLAVDFGAYFAKEDDGKKQLRAAGVPENRDALDAADQAAAERRMYSPLRQALTAAPADASRSTSTTDKPKQPHDPKEDYPFDSADGKLYRLFEGHVVETVLANRLSGAAAGPAIVMVSTDVYSESGKRLLIPKGSRLIGAVTAVASLNQERLFVAFHRLIMPDGYSVSLDQFKGLDVKGQTGLRDLVNHHYGQIFGASLALAAIGATASIGNNSSFGAYNWDTQMRSGMSQEMGQSAQRVMERFLNVLPTFTIRERTRVSVILSNDLLLPDSKQHTMDPDL